MISIVVDALGTVPKCLEKRFKGTGDQEESRQYGPCCCLDQLEYLEEFLRSEEICYHLYFNINHPLTLV